MEINNLTIVFTTINLILLGAIIVVIYKLIQGFKSFIIRNNDLDKKVDTILDKLESKGN